MRDREETEFVRVRPLRHGKGEHRCDEDLVSATEYIIAFGDDNVLYHSYVDWHLDGIFMGQLADMEVIRPEKTNVVTKIGQLSEVLGKP
jgi:hypothetical protein